MLVLTCMRHHHLNHYVHASAHLPMCLDTPQELEWLLPALHASTTCTPAQVRLFWVVFATQ
jgi:hypothetical protein